MRWNFVRNARKCAKLFSAFLTKLQRISAHFSALLCKVFVLKFNAFPLISEIIAKSLDRVSMDWKRDSLFSTILPALDVAPNQTVLDSMELRGVLPHQPHPIPVLPTGEV